MFKLADDRMALVSGISMDPEAAIGVTKKLPPKWVEGVDEVRCECVCVRVCARTYSEKKIGIETKPMYPSVVCL